MTEIPTEALQAAAQAIVGLKPYEEHSLCPLEAGTSTDVGECACWVLGDAIDAVHAAAPYLIAEGRRQAERELRTKIAAEIRARDIARWVPATSDGYVRDCQEQAARIGTGGFGSVSRTRSSAPTTLRTDRWVRTAVVRRGPVPRSAH